MHARLSIHSTCFPGIGLAALPAEWAAVGARRVSLSSDQLAGIDPAQARVVLGGRSVETITHVFHAGPLDLSPPAIAADRAGLSRAIAAAQGVGARSIYLLTGGRGGLDWEAAAAGFSAAIAPCVAEAQAAGVALAIENISPFFAHGHVATNLRDTIVLAEQAGIGVCIDYFACWTEAAMPALIRRAMPRLVLVQVSDYVPGDRALPCRAVPGDGAIPWPTVLGWLRDAGYDGAFDLELIGPRIDAEGHRAAVRRAAGIFGAMLTPGEGTSGILE